MFKRILYIVSFFSVVLFSCQKEYSFEGVFTGESKGTLKDSSGNCHEMVLGGKYEIDTALNTSNFVLAKVNFTATGKWLIKSDTINGIWFIDSGYTTMLGMQTLRVQGYGTPILPIVFDVNLFYSSSTCKFICNASGMPIGPQPIIRDYFPTTQNSSWTYFNTTIMDSLVVSVIPNTTTISGLVYDRLEVFTPFTNTRDTLFYRKDGLGNYYRYYSVTAAGPYRDYEILKDNVPINTTWQSPTVNITNTGIPTQARLKFTIINKNVMVNINSQSIDSVIKVKEEWQFLIGGSFQTLNTNEHWFAKNIGQINFVQVNPIAPQSIAIRRWRVF